MEVLHVVFQPISYIDLSWDYLEPERITKLRDEWSKGEHVFPVTAAYWADSYVGDVKKLIVIFKVDDDPKEHWVVTREDAASALGVDLVPCVVLPKKKN